MENNEVKIIEKETNLRGIKIILTANIYPQKESDRKHIRVGFGKIVVANLVEIKVDIYLNKESKEYWIALPSKKVKGKFSSVVYLEKEDKQLLNELLNNKEIFEEENNEGENNNEWKIDL